MVAIPQRNSLAPDSEYSALIAQPAVGRTLTARQVRAIRTAMETFVEEDLAFGRHRNQQRWCVRCTTDRPAAGFIAYDGANLCNDCATDYELSRARGLVASPREFITRCPRTLAP